MAIGITNDFFAKGISVSSNNLLAMRRANRAEPTPAMAPATTSDGLCTPRYSLEKPTPLAHNSEGIATYHFG